MKIKEIQEDLVDEFAMFEDWMQRYEYMIDLGKSAFPTFYDYNNDSLLDLVVGNYGYHVAYNDKINYTADSDAIITKGIIAILLRVFSNQTPDAILSANTDFIDEIGLKEHLSPNRANGLSSMIKQLKLYAIAYKTKINDE